jgi:hypothetical protein
MMAGPHLSDFELDELLRRVSPDLLPYLRRLLDEVRELRDQAAEREFMYSQEIER